MKILLPAVAAALLISPAAFAAGSAPSPTPATSEVTMTHSVPTVDNDATKALNMLEAQGYGSFTNFRRAGNNYLATVSQNGETFQVTIDPLTGQITRG